MPDDATLPDQDAASAAAQTDSAPVADAQTSDASSGVTPTAADSAPADAQRSADNGSLAAKVDAQSTQTTAPTKPQPGFVPESDFRNLQRELSRRSNELRQFQERMKPYEGVDPSSIAAWRKQQEEARQAKLPRWSPKHPEHAGYSSLKTRWQQANATYQRLAAAEQDPAKRQALQQHILSDFSPEEVQEMRTAALHRQQFQERMAEDPEGTLAELVESRVQQILGQREQQFQAHQQAEQSVGQWFNDPANKAVVESQGQWMEQALQSGVKWALVQREAEIRHLRAQLGNGTAKVMAAEERTRLAKASASITRDPITAPISDPYEQAKRLAKERGIEVGGPGFMEVIEEVQTSLK